MAKRLKVIQEIKIERPPRIKLSATDIQEIERLPRIKLSAKESLKRTQEFDKRKEKFVAAIRKSQG